MVHTWGCCHWLFRAETQSISGMSHKVSVWRATQQPVLLREPGQHRNPPPPQGPLWNISGRTPRPSTEQNWELWPGRAGGSQGSRVSPPWEALNEPLNPCGAFSGPTDLWCSKTRQILEYIFNGAVSDNYSGTFWPLLKWHACENSFVGRKHLWSKVAGKEEKAKTLKCIALNKLLRFNTLKHKEPRLSSHFPERSVDWQFNPLFSFIHETKGSWEPGTSLLMVTCLRAQRAEVRSQDSCN